MWVQVSYLGPIDCKRNRLADKESRKFRDNLEQTLKKHMFQKKKIGTVTINLFASNINHKVEMYYFYSIDTDSC